MEKEKNNPTKDPTPTKIDIWDRLIKLEKRNSQPTLFNDSNSQASNEEDKEQIHFWWPEGQADKNIRSYWEQINEIYFQATKDIDMGRIEELVEFLQTPEKDATGVKYANPAAYETFKEIIAESYKHFYSDTTLDRINVHNLQKQFYLTLLKQQDITCDSPDIVTLPVRSKEPVNLHDKTKCQTPTNPIKAFLKKESKELDDTIARILAVEKTGNDEISLDLSNISTENQTLHQENQKSLSSLKERILNNSEAIHLPQEGPESASKSKKGLKKNLVSDYLEDPSVADLQLKYLQKLIVKLENQQTAETIKCVLDCKKSSTESKGYQFCVLFDEALAGKRFWIEEYILQKLDNLRERSLFKIYDIPQHIKRSTYSPNILGFEFCNKKADSAKSSSQRDQKWKDLMKERLGEENTVTAREKLQDKLAQMGMCHHCRHLYPEDFLVKCNYQNTIVNFQLNSSFSKKDLKSYKKPEESTVKPLWDERRQPYLFYRRQEGEITCYRKFCRLCLKLNHDASVAQNPDITSILCPFCKKSCCCSRCNRNEHIDKLRTLYVSLGGDLESIRKESYYEKYICQHDQQLEEIISQKKSVKLLTKTLQNAGYALKPTKGKKTGSIAFNTKYKIQKYKQNVENLKFMKNLRMQMEKARMLCSQVSKRESVKMHMNYLKTELFNLEVSQVFNLTGKKREGPDLGNKKANDEPKITKKVKTGNNSASFEKMEVEHSNKDEIRRPIVVVKKRGRPRKNTSILTEKSKSEDDGSRGRSASSEKSSSLRKNNNSKDDTIKVKQMKEKTGVKKTPKATTGTINTAGAKVGKPLPEMRGRSKELPAEREKQMHNNSNSSPVKKQQNHSNSQKKTNEVKETKKLVKSKDKAKVEDENIEVKEKSQGRQPTAEKAQKSRSPKIALRGLAITKTPLSVLKQNSNTMKNNRQGDKSHGLTKELRRILDYQHEDQFEVFKTTKGLGRVTRNSNNKNKLRNNKKYHYSQ